MASSFPTSVDVIPDPGPTLSAVGREHSMLHQSVRDGLRAVQTYVKDQIGIIKANGWVTNARIADRAVQDRNISSVAAAKVIGTLTNSLASSGNITAAGDIQAGDFLRAGTLAHYPAFKIQRYGGTLSGDGVVMFAHTIPLLHRRALLAQFWWEGASSEMRRCTLMSIDGSNILIAADPDSGGGSMTNRKWRGAVLYTEDSPAW